MSTEHSLVDEHCCPTKSFYLQIPGEEVPTEPGVLPGLRFYWGVDFLYFRIGIRTSPHFGCRTKSLELSALFSMPRSQPQDGLLEAGLGVFHALHFASTPVH